MKVKVSSSKKSIIQKKFLARRSVLKAGLAGLSVLASPADAAVCALTAQQTLGPYHPLQWHDYRADLTGAGKAKGEMITVRGRVLDTSCKAVPGALVELWQANHWGRYHHIRDRQNPLPVDPEFAGRGRVRSNVDGYYQFTTIKPASYEVGGGWRRPPHLHFKVTAPGYKTLVTQMYFHGDPLNPHDQILQALSPSQQTGVIVTFTKREQQLNGQFDLVIHA